VGGRGVAEFMEDDDREEQEEKRDIDNRPGHRTVPQVAERAHPSQED